MVNVKIHCSVGGIYCLALQGKTVSQGEILFYDIGKEEQELRQ